MQFKDFFISEIKDNSYYSFQKETDRVYSFSRFNNRNDKKIHVETWYSWRSDNEANEILRLISSHLKSKLTDKQFVKDSLYIINNGDYEHNTLDPFIEYISGTNSGMDGVTISTGNVVGYVSKKVSNTVHTLVVSSRFGDNFLKHIIASTDGFLELPDAGDTSNRGMAEWLLVFLWKIKLKHAYRLGLPKEYVSKTQNTVAFRGNMTNKSMVNNPSFIPPYECTYREHSYDNPATQLIANTFRLIGNKTLIRDCHKLKQDFLSASEGKRVPINNLLSTPYIKNPYYADYNAVSDLSKKIIKRELLDFGDSKDDFSAFFFDVSMLFEYFIRKLLIRKGYVLEEKNAKDYSIPSGGVNNSGYRSLYPDIIINHAEGAVSIYDVKYKNFDFQYGIKREDLFQMHTYVANALNSKIVKSCGFIFPISEVEFIKQGKRSCIEQLMEIGGREINFEVKFFIVPPDSVDNYSLKFYDSSNSFFEDSVR